MQKLLINLLIFSLGFAWATARQHQKISFRLAARIALIGIVLLGLVALHGLFIANQPLSTIFFVLNNSNDAQMGVIYGVCAIYIALLCFIWCISLRFQKRGLPNDV
jgi:hypothetical protein